MSKKMWCVEDGFMVYYCSRLKFLAKLYLKIKKIDYGTIIQRYRHK